jgi:hypothetical protein
VANTLRTAYDDLRGQRDLVNRVFDAAGPSRRMAHAFLTVVGPAVAVVDWKLYGVPAVRIPALRRIMAEIGASILRVRGFVSPFAQEVIDFARYPSSIPSLR